VVLIHITVAVAGKSYPPPARAVGFFLEESFFQKEPFSVIGACELPDGPVPLFVGTVVKIETSGGKGVPVDRVELGLPPRVAQGGFF
jgi:hypothetical protein